MSSSDESDIFEDVGLFEAAVHAKPLELELPALKRLVVALDGSNQDATARLLAAELAQRTRATVSEHAGALEAAAVLAACAEAHANLLILPVPFGRDISQLKDESLGEVVDLLLLEAPLPVLCVRDPMDEGSVAAALANVLLPVNVHAEGNPQAAAWAFCLLGQRGGLELLAIADRDVLEEARRLLGDAIDALALQQSALERTVTHEIAGLIAAVQRQGAERGVHVHVEILMGRAVEAILARANASPRLTIVATPRQHTNPAFHRAADIILGARGPVLIV